MFIKVEPADFFMFRVIMTFDLENPDSEDQDVRDYLTEHDLEPRHNSEGEFESRQCQFMSFGGCYLGNHLQNISQIQRAAVEIELLTAEIRVHLDASPDATTPPAEDQQPPPGRAVGKVVGFDFRGLIGVHHHFFPERRLPPSAVIA